MAPGRKQPTHLRGASSRKGKKYTTAQLAAKKQRVELTIKQKRDVIDLAQKTGFLPDSVEPHWSESTRLCLQNSLMSLKRQ